MITLIESESSGRKTQVYEVTRQTDQLGCEFLPMHAGLLPILHITSDKFTNEPAQQQYLTVVMEIKLETEELKSHVVYFMPSCP